MKKIFAILLCVCLMLSVVACAPKTPAAPTDAPTEAPTTAPTEAPTQAPTTAPTPGMTKIDLSNSVVGVCSEDSATQPDYSQITWYSSLNPGWKDLTFLTDGDYTNEVYWGVDPHERADVYIDLTTNTGAAVAVDQFKLYHSKYKDVPSLIFVLVLEDGTYVENTATLDWKEGTEAEPFVFDYDQTYKAVGLYVWQNQNIDIRAAYGEIELWQRG